MILWRQSQNEETLIVLPSVMEERPTGHRSGQQLRLYRILRRQSIRTRKRLIGLSMNLKSASGTESILKARR